MKFLIAVIAALVRAMIQAFGSARQRPMGRMERRWRARGCPGISGGAGTTTTSRVTGITGGYPTPTDWTSQVRFVDDELQNMSPLDVPFLKYCGGIDQFEATNPKVEWIEDDLWQARLAVSSTTGLPTTTEVTVTLSGNTAYQLHKGMVIQIDSELMWVNTIASDSTFTVTRDYAGSTAAAHVTASTIYMMGISVGENEDSNYRGSPIYAFPYNYCQIFDVAYQISKRQNETVVYGRRGPDLDKMTADTLKQVMVLLEEGCFRGLRYEGSSATDPPSMGGLEQYINSTDSNVTDLNSVAITEKDINDLLQTIFYQVGPANMAKTIICGAWVKRKISGFYEPHYRSTQESKRGGVTVDVLTTDFGPIEVFMHYHCPPATLYMLNADFIDIGHYRGGRFQDEPLAVAGPYFRRHIYGDYTMVLKNAKAHGKIQEILLTA